VKRDLVYFALENASVIPEMLLRLKPCHVCDAISAVAEFMADVATIETLPYM
jgi:hypothetical protein